MKLRFPHWAFALGFVMMLLQPLRAEAALPAGGKYLTAQEMRSIIGDSVTGRYYNGSEYVDVTYYYNAVQSISDLQQYASSDIVTTGKQYLVYAATVGTVNQNPDYITFDIHPEFSLLDTQFIYMFCGHSIRTGVSASVYNPPRWEWVINGQTTVYQNQALNPGQDQWAHARASQSFWWTYAECAYQSNISTSGYSLRASFYGNNVNGSTAYFVIGLPYISDAGSGVSGTGTPVVTGTDINIDVDLTETNSLLGSIKQGIENLANGILNGLKNLFIPSETFMTEWKDDMSDELEEHLGGIYEATDILHDWAAQFRNVQASSEIYVPAVTVPLAGVSWTVGDWHVPLKPTGMPALVYDGFALIVDFLALAAFLNMCHKKLEVVLVPESEKVD